MRHLLLILGVLAGSAGAAWGQTTATDTEVTLCHKAYCRPVSMAELQAIDDVDMRRPAIAPPGRAYTLDEIDRMRAVEYARAGNLLNHGVVGELRVQTDMKAGISPEALETEAKK